jgi:hypothetical protein
MGAEILHGAQIHRPAPPQEIGQLGLDAGERQQARFWSRFERHQQVDVAVRPRGPFQD